jgi:O-antigen ligase
MQNGSVSLKEYNLGKTLSADVFFTKGIVFSTYAFIILTNTMGLINPEIPWIFRFTSMACLLGFAFFRSLVYQYVYGKPFIIWGTIFAGLLFISILYSPSTELALNGISDYLIVFVLVGSMIQVAQDNEHINKILNAFVVSGVIVSLLSFIFLSDQLFSGARFAGSSNANAIMVKAMLPVFILIYRCFTEKKHSLFNFILLVPCATVMMLTGSRKGLFIPAVFTVVFIFINQKSRILKRGLMTLMIFIFIGYLIFQVPELYTAVGRRVEYFVMSLFGFGETTYFSDLGRAEFRRQAFLMFLESPIIGHGINAFANIYGMYSHNNYAELLASLGFVGFGAFYSIYIYCIGNLVKLRKITVAYKNLNDFALSLLIANLFFDWGAVSYNILNCIVSLAIAVCIILLTKRNVMQEVIVRE